MAALAREERRRALRRRVLSVASELFLWIAVTCALTAWFHRGVVLRGETFQLIGGLGALPSDPAIGRPVKDPLASAGQFEPWLDHLLRERERHGTTPLWNPYQGLGAPFLANMQTAVWHPLTYVQAHVPEPWRFDVAVLARFASGMLGMILLARLLGQDRIPSLLCGVAFAFTGYFLFFANMVHLNVEFLLPWHVLAVELAFRGWLRGGGLLFGASVWLSHAGGFPESTALALFVALLYGLFRLAIPARREIPRLAPSGHLSVGAVWGTLLAAPLILPFLEFVDHAVHLHATDRRVGMTSFPWETAFGLLVPHMERFGTGMNGPFSYDTPPYVGLAVAVLAGLAVVALVRRETFDGPTCFFAAFTALVVAKLFDAPVVRWIGTWPVLDQIILRKYLGPLIAFGFAFLAGRGVQVFARFARVRPLLLFVCIGAVWLFLHEVHDLALPGTPDPTWISATPTWILLALVGLALAAVFAPRAFAWRPLATTTALAFVVLAFGELQRYAPQRRGSRAAATVPPRGLQGLLGELRERRVVATEGVLPPNWATRYEIQDARLLDAVVDAGYHRLIDALFSMPLRDRWDGPRHEPSNLNLDALDVLGIEFLIATRDWMARLERPPLAVAVARDAGSPVWERDAGMLRLRVGPAGRVFLGPFVVPQQGSAKVQVRGTFDGRSLPALRTHALGPPRPVFDTGERTLAVLASSYADRVATIAIDERSGALERDLFGAAHATLLEVLATVDDRLVSGSRVRMRNVRWGGTRLVDEAFLASQRLPIDLVADTEGRYDSWVAPEPLRLWLGASERPAFAAELAFHFDFGERVPPGARARLQVHARPVVEELATPRPRATPVGLELDFEAHRGRVVYVALEWPRDAATPARFQDARLADQSFRFRVVRDEPLLVLENRLAHPRAYLVHDVEAVSDAELARRLRAPNLDPRRRAYVTGPEARTISSPAPRGEPRVVVERPASDRLRLEIAPESPALLVVLETTSPGWRAKVDGRETPVVPVLGSLRGVYVDDGDRVVEMVYAPTSYVLGRLLLCAGVFLVVLHLAWPLVRRPRGAP